MPDTKHNLWRGGCNRCGSYTIVSDRDSWPAGDRNFYGCLCEDCRLQLNDPKEWERRRMELVARHSE